MNKSKDFEIKISENYNRLEDDYSVPGIYIENDGNAVISTGSKNGTPGGVWHGTAIAIETKGLTAETVKECYERVGIIKWETYWNGSNHVGAELSDEMKKKVFDLEDLLLEEQQTLDYFGIEDCDWDTILKEQKTIKDYSELTQENLEQVANEIFESLFEYEDKYSVNCVELRDIEAKLEEELM